MTGKAVRYSIISDCKWCAATWVGFGSPMFVS